MITDINNPGASTRGQSELATMYDGMTPASRGIGNFNHIPGGMNVLYLDGHVKFLKYEGFDGEYPVHASQGILTYGFPA